jgi:GntR family transcriptional repressor for pyruvate dehydrogenase complex
MDRATHIQPLGETVTATLRTEILRGQFRAGERLPSERDLTARFGASRGVVREALKRLEQLGLAEIQAGGARVRPIDQASLDVVGYLMDLGPEPNIELLRQVHEVMVTLLDKAITELASRASDAEIEGLRRLVQLLISGRLTQAERVETRMALGSAIMEASQNLVLQMISHALRVQMHPRLRAMVESLGTPPDVERLQALDAALGARDTVEIQRQVRFLIEATHALFVQAMAENGRHGATDRRADEIPAHPTAGAGGIHPSGGLTA